MSLYGKNQTGAQQRKISVARLFIWFFYGTTF